MTEIKRLSLVLTALHAVGTVFGIVVFAITAASIAEANTAASAINNAAVRGTVSNADASGALSALAGLAGFNRKLLATRGSGGYYVVGFASFLNFTMFVSISDFLLSGFLALCYFRPAIYDKTLGALATKSPAWAKWPFFELVLACVWCIFWLAAAGAASDSPFVRIGGYCTGIAACDQINAVVALSWLSWLIWLAVVVLLAVEYGLAARKGRKTKPTDPAPAAAAAAPAANGAEVKKPAEASEAAEAAEAAETAEAAEAAAPAPAAATEDKPKEQPAIELVTATHD